MGIPNIHFGEKQLDKAKGKYVITPLRHLDAIITSWARRDLNLAELHQAIQIMVDYPIDFILPVDLPDSPDYLDRLNKERNLNLQTDWTPVTDNKRSAENWSIDPVWREKLHEDFDSFFQPYYGRN